MNDSNQETDNNGEEEEVEETTAGTPFEEQQHIPPEGMLDRASLEAMTRSWWGTDDEEGMIVEEDDDDDSTSTGPLEESFQMDALQYGNVQGFSHLDSTALEAVGAGGLLEVEEETMDGDPTSRVAVEQNETPGSHPDGDALNSFLNDDDPRLHPPVASLPAQDDDEKAAYRRRLPPRLLSLSQPTTTSTGENAGRTSDAAPEQEDDPEREESYRLPGLSNNLQAEEPQPGAQAMEGRGPRPSWANASAWTRSSDAGVRQTLRESIIPFRLRRGSADLGGVEIPTVEASAVNPAETVVYATNVAPDQTAKARKITVGLGILAILLIVGLSTGLTISLSRDDRIDESDLDLQCFMPPEDQDVFVHCKCFNTTEGLVWTEEEQAYYQEVQSVLLENTSVLEEPHFIESCTLQNQCMVWTANYKRRNMTAKEAELALYYPEIVTQTYILCLTYQSLDGPNWIQNDGWLVNKRACDWFGITCSFLSRATGLKLPRNGLKGSFPSELGRMAFLRELELSRNAGITGALPTEIGQASALHVLDLSHTSMNGTLPSELENLEILDRLVLSNNSFSGTIPDNMTIRMREMYLDHNVLTGTLHSELLALTNLEILNLANNSLVGSIPDRDDSNSTERRKAWRHLEHLDVSRNSLMGSLPEFLGSRRWLVTTFIYETLLSGPIPETYCQKEQPHARIIANCNGTGLIRNCSCCDELVLCVEELPQEVQDFI